VTFGMGFSLLFAILPPVGRQLGFTEFQVGIVFATGSVCLFFGAPLWGRKSDVWGRKPVLMVGFIGYALAQLAFVAFIELGLNGIIAGTVVFGALLLCRVASTLTVSAVNGPASGYIADTTTEHDRTSKLSWVNASFGIGSALGPGVGGLLAAFGVLVPFYAVSAWALLMALMIWVLLPEPKVHRPSKPSTKLHMRDKRILPVIILTSVSFFAITANLQLAAFYVQDHIGYNSEDTTQAVGALLTIMAIAALLTQVFIIRRFRMHPYTLLVIGMPLGTLGLLGVTLTSTLTSFLIFFALIGLAIGLVGPALSGAASLSVGAEEQGGVAGIVEASRAIGSFAAGTGGTALYDFGPRVPYGLTTFALFVMSIYAFYLWIARRRALQEP
jgi:MFS family permease